MATEIYKLTDTFPRDEKYALTDQLRRAILSVPANIAEAFGRYHALDKIKFYYYARGSAYESLNFILFAKERGYISDDILKTQEEKITKTIIGLNQVIKFTREKEDTSS